MLFSQVAEDKGDELILSSFLIIIWITNNITNNNFSPANSKKFAFLLVLLAEVGFAGLTHKQKLATVQTFLDGCMKVLNFVIENSYDNSKSAQRNRSKKNKYEPQNGANAVLMESDAKKFKGIQERSEASHESKKLHILSKPTNKLRTRSKNWRHHSVCNCTQTGAGVPHAHSLSF